MAAPDRKIWEHAIETVLLLGAGALAAVAVLPGMGVPGWAIPAVEGITTLVASFVVWSLTGSGPFSLYAIVLGGFLAGWTGWAESTGVWRVATIITWLGAMIVLAPLAALAAAAARNTLEEPAAKPDPDAEKRKEMAKWEYMFAQVVECEGVQVLDLSEERAGRTLRLQLPRSGRVTLSTLRQASARIEVILKLRPGAVEFDHASHSGDIVMRLRERDIMTESSPLRPEHRASTINKPFAIGIQEDGSIAMITLRELHAMIIGTTGAGKSNLINVILAQLSYCVDTVIWVIDMKGGRVARPWLQPWIEGNAAAPAIDWVATTREEAALMMTAFVDVIEARMNSGIGGSKIVPSASMPQIILIVDEMSDLFGMLKGSRKEVGEGATTNQQFIRMGETITQKGRSEAAASVWASQRGTNSMAGSGDMKANTKLRIILGAVQESEARYVNADNRTAQKRSAAMVDTPGAGVITMGRKSSLLTKFFLHDHPKDPASGLPDATLCDNGCVPACPVYRTAQETASIRPPLDRVTAAGMGDVYATRWERAGPLLRRPVPAGAGARGTSDDVDMSQFDEIIKGMRDPEAKLDAARKRMREILAARGSMGATPAMLQSKLEGEGLGRARETIQRWLRDDEAQGVVHNASFGRWKIGRGDSANAA